jgi:hypothetical protein
MLEGRPFVVFTDHKPLVGALARAPEPRSDRQRRQLSAITEFTAEIRHISGPTNVVADTLSRPAAVSGIAAAADTLAAPTAVAATSCASKLPVSAAISYADVVKGAVVQPVTTPPQAGPPAAGSGQGPPPPGQPPADIKCIAEAQKDCPDCQRAASSPNLRVISVQMEGTSVLVDVSSGVMWPLVPADFRR